MVDGFRFKDLKIDRLPVVLLLFAVIVWPVDRKSTYAAQTN